MARRSRSRFGIQFNGFEELMEQFDKLDGDLKEVTEECLKKAHEIVTPNVQADMNKHNRTGTTKRSIATDSTVKWEGTKATIKVGFKFPEGLSSVFLMYGTPRMQKDQKLYNDIYGGRTKNQIARAQREILENAIQNRLGG